MSRAILVLIRVYQLFDAAKHQVLLTFFGVSSVCKHRPTCSQYAIQQIKTRGTIRGLLAGTIRVLTCW